MILTKTVNGPMNVDTSSFQLPSSSVRYRLNCRVGVGGNESVGTIQNIMGNSEVAFVLPSGTNKVIGLLPNENIKKVYLFIWNSENHHSIQEFDYLTNTVTKVIESIADSDGIDILKFSPDSRINHANIVDGQDYNEAITISFSLTTGAGLLGTTAVITNNNTELEDVTGLGGTVSTTTVLSMDTNYVTVSTDDATAISMSVNGVSRTNGVTGAGTWVETFIITGGPKDISVIVNASGPPTSGPSTGTWTFENDSASNTFSGAAWSDGTGYVNIVGPLAPDTWILNTGDAGSIVAPAGVLVSTISSANSLVITTNSSMAGFADVTIGAQPLQTFPLSGDVFGITTISGLSMVPSDNILITVRD